MAEKRYRVHIELTTAANEHTARELLAQWRRNVFVSAGYFYTADGPTFLEYATSGINPTQPAAAYLKLNKDDVLTVEVSDAPSAPTLCKAEALRSLDRAWEHRCDSYDPWPDVDDPQNPHDATAEHVFKLLRDALEAAYAEREPTNFRTAQSVKLERVELLERQEKESPNKVDLHFCASPNCPGYVYRASEISHPYTTCGDSKKHEYDRRD